MKVYQLARVSTKCCGHGDYSSVIELAVTESYGSTPFPLYTDRAAAEKVAEEHWCQVIELEIIGN